MAQTDSEDSDENVHHLRCTGAPPPSAPAAKEQDHGSVLERNYDKPPGGISAETESQQSHANDGESKVYAHIAQPPETDQSGLAQKHDSAGGNNPQQRYPHSKSFNLFSSCGITCLKFYQLLTEIPRFCDNTETMN